MKFRASALAPWLAFVVACSGKEAPAEDTGLPAASASTPGEGTGTDSPSAGTDPPGEGSSTTGPNPSPVNTPSDSANPPGTPGVVPPTPPGSGGAGPGVVNPPPNGTDPVVNPPIGSGGTAPDPTAPEGSGGTPVDPPVASGGGAGDAPVTPATPVDEPPPVRPTLVTSANGAYWVEGEATELQGGSPTFSVDETAMEQEWLGFGGTFNEAGWEVLSLLDEAERERAIKLLFSRGEGANFTWGRFPLGSSDYAMDRYSLNDTEGDYAMESFSIDRDKELLIPYIRAALAVKPSLRLWASPWSPPAWMKTPQDFNGGRITDNPETLGAYALYFALFVEQYEAEGIDVEMVMPQNEPGYATNYPSCLWTPELLRDFVRDYLGPTFAERNVGAEIWFGTMSAPEDAQHLSTVMADSEAAQYVKGFGLQWNTMSSTGSLSSQGLPVMQTEHKCGNYRFMPETYNSERPPNDHAYGEESWGLIRDWIKAGVHSYSAWNMVLDSQGENLDGWLQNSLLTVDRSTNTLTATPAYYVFRHISYFVEPGARRLGTSGNTDALAFQNPDGSLAAIVFNSGGSAQQMTVAMGGTNLQFEVPGRGWASVFHAAE